MDRKQTDGFFAISTAVRRLFHRLSQTIEELHAGSGVSPGMRAVLDGLVAHGPQTVPQMARARPVSRQHIQGIVNQLLDAGLVEYVHNPAHQRSKLVRPTKLGSEAFENIRTAEEDALRQLALAVPAKEMAMTAGVLNSVAKALESPEWQSMIVHKAREKGDKK